MTDVTILPLDLSAEAARRRHDRLKREMAGGLDPGSRRAQIACLSGSLARYLHRLREVVDIALSEMPADDPAASYRREAATGMTRLAHVVMAGATGPADRPFPET